MAKPVGGDHRIAINIDSVYGLTAEFTCHSDDHGPCRWTCGLDCEIWDEECQTHHPRKRISYCNPLEFIHNDDSEWWEKYIGPPNAEVHCGAIDLIWDPSVDTYRWKYADD